MRTISVLVSSLVIVAVCSVPLHAQTRVHLATESRAVDFSASDYTKPFKTGAQLPAGCSTGEFFFNTQGGTNALYACVSPNIWTQQATNGGSSSSPATFADFAVTRTSSVLTVGASCGTNSPCTVRVGNSVYKVSSPATATITSGTGSGVARVYITDAGVTAMEYSQAAGITVAANNLAISAPIAPSFPVNSIPVAEITITSGVWDVVTDLRSYFAGVSMVGGNGVTVNQTTGRWQVDVDPAVVPSLGGLDIFTGSVLANLATQTAPNKTGATDPAACDPTVSETFFNTTSKLLKVCTASNTWSVVGPTISQGTYSGLPTTCTAGDVYVLTDSLFPFARCSAANTWSKFYNGKVITPAADLVLTHALQSGVTSNVSRGYESLKFSASGSATPSISSWAAPSAPYVRYIHTRLPVQWDSADARVFYVGFTDGTGTQQSIRCGVASSLLTAGTWCDVWLTTGGTSTELKFSPVSTFGTTLQGDVCFVLEDDGTNLHWGISLDGGDTSSEFFRESRTARFTSGPTRLFIGGVDTASNYPQTVTFIGTR